MGMILSLTNLFGFFCTFGGIYYGMILYSSIEISIFVGIASRVTTIVHYREKFIKRTDANFRRIWAIGGFANYVQKIEKDLGCCGWNNVFDYCSGIV